MSVGPPPGMDSRRRGNVLDVGEIVSMSRRLSAMIVTNFFPPDAAVGTHRTVGWCKHLAEMGWQVTVITATPSSESTLDNELRRLYRKRCELCGR